MTERIICTLWLKGKPLAIRFQEVASQLWIGNLSWALVGSKHQHLASGKTAFVICLNWMAWVSQTKIMPRRVLG